MIVHSQLGVIMERRAELHLLLSELRPKLANPDGSRRKMESTVYSFGEKLHDMLIATEIELVELRRVVATQLQSFVGAANRSSHSFDTTEPMHAPAAGPGNKRKLPAKSRATTGASGPGRRNSKAAAATSGKKQPASFAAVMRAAKTMAKRSSIKLPSVVALLPEDEEEEEDAEEPNGASVLLSTVDKPARRKRAALPANRANKKQITEN